MANNTNTQTEVKKEEEKKNDITIVDHPTFDFNFKSTFVNTMEISDLVNDVFGRTMRDYTGCRIMLNTGNMSTNIVPYGKFYVELYFKDLSNSRNGAPVANLERRSCANGESAYGKLLAMTSADRGRTFNVTDETYEIIDKFRFACNKNIKGPALTTEKVTNYGYLGNYNSEICVCITGIDLEKVIAEVYGRRTDEGVFEYQATPATIVANTNGEYVIQVTQLDVNSLNNLRKTMGAGITSSEFHQYNH